MSYFLNTDRIFRIGQRLVLPYLNYNRNLYFEYCIVDIKEIETLRLAEKEIEEFTEEDELIFSPEIGFERYDQVQLTLYPMTDDLTEIKPEDEYIDVTLKMREEEAKDWYKPLVISSPSEIENLEKFGSIKGRYRIEFVKELQKK